MPSSISRQMLIFARFSQPELSYRRYIRLQLYNLFYAYSQTSLVESLKYVPNILDEIISPAKEDHDDNTRSIYSLHTSLDGKHLITAGSDNNLKIWSIDDIFPVTEEPMTDYANRVLALPGHKAPVLCVRYSNSGKFIASGSEDGSIIIWRQHGYDASIRGPSYVIHTVLNGHDNNVQDLAWSPTDMILISVGSDSRVIVWDGQLYEKIRVITAHNNRVKGISVDPTDQYFATSSDDGTFKIFQYKRLESGFSIICQESVQTPFKGSSNSTFFRRSSWSPDGNHIAVPNAFNKPVSSVAIINRNTWDSDISLIGHTSPSEIALFCPRVFTPIEHQPGQLVEEMQVTVIATAGQDRTLTIWNTSRPRPVLVAHNICDSIILDLAWSHDGKTLFLSSLDGSVVGVKFELSELGWAVDPLIVDKQLERINPNLLREKHKLKKRGRVLIDVDENNDTSGDDYNPIKIEKSQDYGNNGIKNDTEEEFGRTGVPISDEITNVNKNDKGSKRGLTEEIGDDNDIQNENKRTKCNASESVSKSTLSNIMRVHKLQDQSVAIAAPEFLRSAKPSLSTCLSQVRLSLPKIAALITVRDSHGYLLEVKNGAGTATSPSRVLSVKFESTGEKTKKEDDKKVYEIVFLEFIPSHIHLATGDSKNFWALATECSGTIYIYSPNGRRLMPPIVLGYTLSFLESHGNYLMAVTNTGLVWIWDILQQQAIMAEVSIAPILDTGSKFVENELVRGSSVTQCGVTGNGSPVFTLGNGQGFTYNCTMGTWHRISESWWAIGSQYWDVVAGAGSDMQLGRDYDRFGSRPYGVIGSVERKTDEAVMSINGRGRVLQRMAKATLMKEGFEGLEGTVSIAHLENRLGAAIIIGSKEELRYFLKAYSRRIAEEGMLDRLEEVCQELLGPVFLSDDECSKTWNKELCGIDKHELLREIILAVGKYREAQRVIIEYAECLRVIN
ncbi:Hira-domain-containing protein [Nadsonia fulvescens var. elongata DSM 6958]|uniref:Protein HIR n=1 Tax=Nadsonia fulvescens var. elongata DSM 6958 TaxID=857566 RepID=A0A1E3PQI5_9ASCO|nr:Hira-domain-containing protein [Nadsonia fulvescens var. elongata DSM 6958]